MILDERTEFCDATALDQTGTGIKNVGDVIDLGATPGNPGLNKDLWLIILISTAVTSGGAASVDFLLVSDSTSTPAVDGSASQHLSSGSIAKATLVAGYTVLKARLPAGEYERYLGIQQNVSSNALTAGAINAFLTTNPEAWKAYPDALDAIP